MMDIRCFFNLGQGKDVKARVTGDGVGQTFNIECEGVTVSYYHIRHSDREYLILDTVLMRLSFNAKHYSM